MRVRPSFLPPALAAAALLAAGAPSTAAAQAPSVPSVEVVQCVSGVSPEQRFAVFEGAMPADDGATVLSMRFELAAQAALGKPFKRVKGVDGLGTWVRAAAGAGGFIFDKRVNGLLAGSRYRVTVQYRWQDAAGKVVRRAARTSRVCRQLEVRPDLKVTGVAVRGGVGGAPTRYVVTVKNVGKGPAPAVAVALEAGTVRPPRGIVAALGPGASSDVTVAGPACAAGAALRAQVDPDNLVEEPDEADDVLLGVCPVV